MFSIPLPHLLDDHVIEITETVLLVDSINKYWIFHNVFYDHLRFYRRHIFKTQHNTEREPFYKIGSHAGSELNGIFCLLGNFSITNKTDSSGNVKYFYLKISNIFLYKVYSEYSINKNTIIDM